MAAETKGPSPFAAHFASQPLPWLFLAAVVLVSLSGSVLWVAGYLVAAVSGVEYATPFSGGVGPIVGLFSNGTAQTFNGLNMAAVWVVAGFIALALAAGAVKVCSVVQNRSDDRRLALPSDLDQYARPARLEEMRYIRPELDTSAKGLADFEIGITLGKVDRIKLIASFEETILMVGNPRSGKTRGMVLPQLLDELGPVVVTANKPDVWAFTHKIRGTYSKVWNFDPQHVTFAPPDFVYDPLSRVTDYESAAQLAEIFVPKRSSDKNVFFSNSARTHLTLLLFAAKLAPEPSMRWVKKWLDTSFDQEPVDVLRGAGHVGLADKFLDMMTRSDKDTWGNIVATTRSNTSFLDSPTVLEMIVPDGTRETFNPVSFVANNETIYLHSDTSKAGSVTSLISAMFDHIVQTLKSEAIRQGGRLAKPAKLVLDEVANIVPLESLPENLSYFGSMNISTLTILQNYGQAEAVWGKEKAAMLWNASTIKLMTGGSTDLNRLEEISKLAGQQTINQISVSDNPQGVGSNISITKEDLLTVGDIREIKRGQFLMIATNSPIAIIDAVNINQLPNSDELEANNKTALEDLPRRFEAAEKRKATL